jgi:translation initiation factor IF-1
VSGKTTIEAEGRVTEALPGMVFWVEMPNGHKVLGHLSRGMRMDLTRVEPGDKVRIEMSPFDFSKGRIVSKKS